MERIEMLEGRVKEGREGGGEEKREKKGVENRLKEVEKLLERNEKDERRKNIIIRGLEIKKGKRRETAEEILGMIGARVVVRQVIRIGGDKEKGREMVLVKLENEEQRWEILGKKLLLKGRRERIMEDLIWEERRLRWRLEEFARIEEKKGRVWVGNRRVKIDGY